MNYSYFNPEFSGKPEEDPEAHTLKMIDWKNTHSIALGQRVQRFPFL